MPIEFFSQSTWAGGEFSPRVSPRDDIEAYGAGASLMTNFIAIIEGGADYRAGTIRLGNAMEPPEQDPPIARRSRLIEFQRSSLEGFVLELGHQKMRIWDPNTFSALEDAAGFVEVDLPYTSSQLYRLYWHRQGDIMLIHDVLGELPTYVVQRREGNVWTSARYEFRDGPWRDIPTTDEGESVTLTVAGNLNVGGTVTLTSTIDIFDPDHVGALIRMREDPGNLNELRWSSGVHLRNENIGRLYDFNGRVYRLIEFDDDPDDDLRPFTGGSPPIHEAGRRSDGVAIWEYVHDGAGRARITSVNSPSSVTATVTALIPEMTSTQAWQIQAYNDADGYPSAGAFFQERLQTAGAYTGPQTLHGSRVADYNPFGANFHPGQVGLIADDDAVTRTLSEKSVNPVGAMLAADRLYLFTTGGIHVVSGPSRDEAITPAGVLAYRLRGSYGAQPGIAPLMIGTQIVYVELGGKRLRAIDTDGRPSRPTILSEHLYRNGIADMVWMETWNRLFILKTDGTLAVMIYDADEGYAASSPFAFGGNALIESVAVIRLNDGTERLWLVTNRTKTDGTLLRSVEVKSPEQIQDGIGLNCYLDCAGYFDADDPRSQVENGEEGEGQVDTSAGGENTDEPPAPVVPPPPPPPPPPPVPPSEPPSGEPLIPSGQPTGEPFIDPTDGDRR